MVANVKFTSYTLRNYIKHLTLTHSLTHYYTLFLAYISYTIYAHTISHFQKTFLRLLVWAEASVLRILNKRYLLGRKRRSCFCRTLRE